MDKIFCFGDGFATGHIWPEWPQILQTLLPQHHVITTAGIGAGTEFLVSGFVDLLEDMRNSTVIFQWPYPGRFDKLLQDDSWQSDIANDQIYHSNINTDTQGRLWWLSSGSKNNEIKKYHGRFVQSKQHARRQEIYKALVSHTCKDLNCQIVHTSTQAQDGYSRSERFKLTRQNEIQPSPMVHFYWLIEEIITQTTIKVDTQRQAYLEKIINQVQWVPYDPDRSEIWSKINTQLSVIS